MHSLIKRCINKKEACRSPQLNQLLIFLSSRNECAWSFFKYGARWCWQVFSFCCCCHGMAVRLMMASVDYSFYNGFKVSCFKSLITCFQQVYYQCLEGGKGLSAGLGHQGESPQCVTSQGCPSSERWLWTAFSNLFYHAVAAGGCPDPWKPTLQPFPCCST